MGFIAAAKCAGSCPGPDTMHAMVYDEVNQVVYAICRVCGTHHVETRPRLVAYAKEDREPIKGRLNILK